MTNDRNKDNRDQQETDNTRGQKPQRSSAFNETKTSDEKSTVNPEEEADLEQQRKEALTERD